MLCWVPLCYFSHAILMSFHEAAHGNLGPGRWGNDLRGMILGWFAFVPLSAYRLVHGLHHRHLAEAADAELWPYCDPTVPNWFRRLMVWAELFLGMFVTPIVYLRGVLHAGAVSQRQRREIVRDYLVMFAFWGFFAAAVTWQGAWGTFLAVFVPPVYLAGVLQTLRKFTEHLGLLGNTPETAARTIVDRSLVGRFLSATMLNVTYHTAHHRDASLPYFELPRATEEARAVDPSGNPIFTSYWQGFLDMLPAIANPRVGGQWLDADGDRRTQRRERQPATFATNSHVERDKAGANAVSGNVK
ncbi:MAG: fatty acid desaturase [Pirellulales bacterium]